MSGTVVAVYSRVLEPGQDILITEDVTVQITNITLEVDEKSTDTTRSVLKMQHLEAHPALLQAVAGYDFSDSEDDDDEFDSEDDEDEDDDDLNEDELADMSKLSKMSAASSSSKKSANGKAAAAAAEEDDDEEEDVDFDEDDEESSSDEEEDDFDRQEAEVQICSLLPGKVEHFNTNIILPGGEDFVFRLSGTHKVHIFGHYLAQPTPPQLDESPYDEDSEGEYDSDDEEIYSDDLDESEMGMYDPETGLLMIGSDSEDLDDEDDDEEDLSARFMEIEEAPKKATKAEKPASKTAAVTEETAADKSKLSKNQLKKQAKKEAAAATPAGAATEKKAAEPAAAKKPESKKEEAKAAAAAPTPAKKAPSKKQTTASGLVLEDVKVGSGPAAKSGQRVSMRYIGRLNNGKIFDQNTKGAPFSFKLGKGEVIKGWDEGIAGMQVGGERKLVIPAKLAYGKQGVEGIPPNSTLTFEVKLLSVK